MSEAQNSSYVKSLDGLRAFAVFLVALSHFCAGTQYLHGIFGGELGQVGVMLFFILSGFLMTELYIDLPFNMANASKFIKRRFARIYPLFILTAMVPGFLLCWGFNPASVPMSGIYSWGIFFRTITLVVGGDGILWTIRFEMYFYGFFLVFWFFFGQSKKRLIICIALLVTVLLLLSKGLYVFTHHYRVFMLVHYFIFGVMSSLFFTLHRRKILATSLVGKWLGLISFLGLIFLLPHFSRMNFEDMWPDKFTALALFIFFNILIRDQGYLSRVFSLKWIRRLSKVSYSFYLIHYFIFQAFLLNLKKGSSLTLTLLLYLGTTYLLSEFSYRYIECPVQYLILLILKARDRDSLERYLTGS